MSLFQHCLNFLDYWYPHLQQLLPLWSNSFLSLNLNRKNLGGLIFVEQIVVIIDIAFDLLIWIFDPFGWFRRWRIDRAMALGDKCIITQKEANLYKFFRNIFKLPLIFQRLMEMPGYHISERYADLLKTMWFVFLYGNLLPMATVMFVIYLIIFYWVDKVNIKKKI